MYLSKTGSKGKRILINVVLGILSLVWIFPIVFLIIGSMKTKTEYNMTNFWQLAQRINWKENFEYIVKYSQIFHSVLNSLLYSLFGTVGAIILAVLAAYGLTKLSIKHKMFWFMIIYSGTIFPFQMYLIPVFKAYMKLNLYDTQIGLVVFYIAICIPFSMFVFRNHFMSIPDDVIEASKIDGASKFKTLTDILLPMSKASLSVVFLTQFSWCYNELMFGITFTKSDSIKPVMAALSTFSNNKPAMMVACIIVSVPTIILYILLNKNFNDGIAYQTK